MRETRTSVKVAAGVALLVIIALLYFAALGLGSHRSESTYTGYVVDVVEDKGLIFRPSWINVKTHPRSSSQERFCVLPEDEDELLPTAREALTDGKRVQVEYHRPLWVNPNDCRSTHSIIDDITVVNGTTA